MGVKRGLGANRARAHTISLQVGNEDSMHRTTVEQSRSISIHKVEIDWKKRGLEPQVQVCCLVAC